MNQLPLTIALFSSLLAYGPASASECVEDNFGKVHCARTVGGGAVKLQNQQIVCGRGECALNRSGQALCAKREGGHARIDRTGRVVCSNGCEPATTAHCETLRP